MFFVERLRFVICVHSFSSFSSKIQETILKIKIWMGCKVLSMQYKLYKQHVRQKEKFSFKSCRPNNKAVCNEIHSSHYFNPLQTQPCLSIPENWKKDKESVHWFHSHVLIGSVNRGAKFASIKLRLKQTKGAMLKCEHKTNKIHVSNYLWRKRIAVE